MSTGTTRALFGDKKLVLDPAHDLLRSERQPLDELFKPRTVAVVGASERVGSVGRSVLWNILSSPFGGTVYPINAKRDSILGIRAYKDLKSVPEPIDLVVVTTPSAAVPEVIAEAVELGVPASIIISAGFKEMGPEGQALEDRISKMIKGKMRVVGPNCLGIMNPIAGLNATFAQTIARPGSIAFISQSGALCTAVLDWSLQELVGFSGFVSVGSMLDVDWGDLITYFGNDPRTKSIVIYMETVGNARSFLSAAREVSLAKPIIVIKPGRTAAAAKAAASHTGSLTGSDEVLESAFRRCGVLRVTSIADLFYMSEVLGKQPLPKGRRMCIVTNAGGPGVLATDALNFDGGELAELSDESMKAFNAFLPSAWSHGNPVDILGDAEPERYSKALEIAAKDPGIDGMMVIMTPQGMTDPTQIAENLKPLAASFNKPVLASWMGGTAVAAGEEILNRAGIPTFLFPDAAARAFNYMWQYADNLKSLYETPSLPSGVSHEADRAAAKKIIDDVKESGRDILTEYESKKLLEAYRIPTVPTEIALTPADAVKIADKMGYPIVLKLHSLTITHKTDVGGVVLNLRDAEAVKSAYKEIEASVTEKVGKQHFQGVTVQPMAKLDGYEVIIGSSCDPQFGPVLLFGSGGQLVEVYKDRSLALPPLNRTMARRMMEGTKVYTALKGVRGRKPCDLAALESLLVAFSNLVAEQPWIKEIDINPLLASPDRLLALDARVVIYPKDTKEADLPRLAIRPYPIQFVGSFKSTKGLDLAIRPIRPEDEPMVAAFHGHLSERTVIQRYFQPLQLSQRTAHERLTRICFIDYDREMALLAETGKDPKEIAGIVRLSRVHGTQTMEMALVVRDTFHHQGIGAELLKRAIAVAKAEGSNLMVATILVDNKEMQELCKKAGFEMKPLGDKYVRAEMAL